MNAAQTIDPAPNPIAQRSAPVDGISVETLRAATGHSFINLSPDRSFLSQHFASHPVSQGSVHNIQADAGSVASSRMPRALQLSIVTDDGGEGEKSHIFFSHKSPVIRIGRRETSTIVIAADQNISRDHIVVAWNDQHQVWVVQDLGSLNGTLLDDLNIACETRAPGKKWPLSTGDVITIGEATRIVVTISKFHLDDDDANESPPARTSWIRRMRLRGPQSQTAKILDPKHALGTFSSRVTNILRCATRDDCDYFSEYVSMYKYMCINRDINECIIILQRGHNGLGFKKIKTK